MNNFKKIKNVGLVLLILLMIGSFTFLKIKQNKENNSFNEENKENVDSLLTDNQELLSNIGQDARIKKFSNYEEISDFLERNQTNFSGYAMREGGIAVDSIASPTMTKELSVNEVSGLGSGSDGVQSDYSKTNIQVEGVDESDIIKTDGNYIYAVSYNDLFIIKAYPGEQAEIISKIKFNSRPADLYINGDSLIVFGSNDLIYNSEVYKTFRRQSPYTFFKVFDISDRANPKQIRDLDFEGNYFNSRMIGDYVYFMTNNYSYYVDPLSVVPRVLDSGQVLSEKCSGAEVKCFTPSVYYFDIPYDSYNFTTITVINIKDNSENIKGDIYLLSGGQNVYVSQGNIYITYTKYISEYDLEMQLSREILSPRLSDNDRIKISKIEQVDDSILTLNEKKAKIQQIIERFLSSFNQDEYDAYEKELAEKMKQKYNDLSKELEKTIIHKIAISGNSLQYKASGEVVGSVLNQFSMDENNGYFRIATTKNSFWSRFETERKSSYNNLYVLDSDLNKVGAVEDLASGERIYSVRFMGDRAYVVTFKQIDPLFALDLSDPKNPKVLGELKIPGFSNYLHPYDQNTLIGFGKDVGENEFGNTITKGLKISLFDVSDVSNLKELDTYLMGDMGSDSIALYDHKAFLFSKDKNLLVLPVSLRKSGGNNSWGDISFSGAMVFNLADKKINYIGKIDHSDGGGKSPFDYWNGFSYYDNSVKRSLYIKDSLYTMSNKYLKINNLVDLKEIKNMELKKDKIGDFEIVN